jgi:hypothetical protein
MPRVDEQKRVVLLHARHGPLFYYQPHVGRAPAIAPIQPVARSLFQHQRCPEVCAVEVSATSPNAVWITSALPGLILVEPDVDHPSRWQYVRATGKPVNEGRLPEHSPCVSLTSQIQLNTSKEETSMSETSTLIGYAGRTVGREELALVPTPPATESHRPVPHHEIVKALIETGFATSESSTTNMRPRRMV